MLRWLRHASRGRAALVVTGLLLVLVLGFSIWLVLTFLKIIHFRDNLIDRQYEGSLSTNLGFLVAITSEAARGGALSSDALDRQRDELVHQLLDIRNYLSSLTPLTADATTPANLINLDVETDESALRRLLADSRLEKMPLSQLGLSLARKSDLPDYPFLHSSGQVGTRRSLVFVPGTSVDLETSRPPLSRRLRKELVFSTIAAQQLRSLLRRIDQPRITLAYYIGCSDFIHMVSPQPLTEPGFSPLRSFVDRTYFSETREASGVRESQPYLDVAGGGFVRTYSVFVDNRAVGLCGMLAVDCRLQRLADFWQGVELGIRKGTLRDFAFASYSLTSHEIEPEDVIPTELRANVTAMLTTYGAERLRGGIERFSVKTTKVFTVPLGEDSVGLFVFDAAAMRHKYLSILVAGLILIVGFVSMVALTAYGHRAAAAAEKLHEEVLENLHGGFVIVDRHGSILGSTRRFQQMVGGAGSEGTIDRFLAPESAAEYRRLASGVSFEFAGNLLSGDDGNEPVIVASAPISLPGKSDSRMLILIPSAELEQTIAKRFLNIFSHALKSPVHSILLIADLFRRRNALPRFAEYYSMLYRKVQEFKTLTDNVLRFSAHDVKTIQVELAPTNAAQVLRQVLSDAQERARQKGLKFSNQIPGNFQLLADGDLLQVVVNNLVDNALKYTSAGHVIVRPVDSLTRMQIVVEDSGPGVQEIERERIFELFVQGAQARAEGKEGLGLGLYISRLYVEAMGGSLRYEPVFDQKPGGSEEPELVGSRFIVEFQRPSGRTNSE